MLIKLNVNKEPLQDIYNKTTKEGREAFTPSNLETFIVAWLCKTAFHFSQCLSGFLESGRAFPNGYCSTVEHLCLSLGVAAFAESLLICVQTTC